MVLKDGLIGLIRSNKLTADPPLKEESRTFFGSNSHGLYKRRQVTLFLLRSGLDEGGFGLNEGVSEANRPPVVFIYLFICYFPFFLVELIEFNYENHAKPYKLHGFYV